ncbi:phage major capsid protein, P2 family [Victivallis sp. Marseille-Q1083]|uniref:phage major capsid protein, P2 family n=1 Tax=Victivallis sp. Marseille-Q1083 TaxID=2717288 RepID=UPI00158EDE9E|nr:phage major capsid protein, P2 family [Victivallis sp. Marseille-Q1083]
MRFESRLQFEAMQKQLAVTYGVADVRESFEVTTPMAQRLLNAVQESDAFLSRCALISTTDTTGEVVTLGLSRRLAGRTDTSGSGKRQALPISKKDGRKYLVTQTNFDYALRYNEIDVWRRYSDYAARIAAMVNRQMALDLLCMGWYGKSAAADTDITSNPLLEDVLTGWFERLKTQKPANFVSPAATESVPSPKITFGASGDYKNLDQAGNDLLSMIPIEHRTGREIVLIGRGLLAWEVDILFELYGQKPTEKQAMQVLKKGIAGMEAVTPAGFPDLGMMVTDPVNLQYYVQDGTIRKQIKDEPAKDQIETYQSQNMDYQIGDLDAIAALDHAKVEDPAV